MGKRPQRKGKTGQVAGEFNKFEKWLLSADGGLKRPKSASQHAFQAKTVLQAIGGTNVGALHERDTHDVFLGRYTKQKKFLPGTIQSYLGSLKHFFTHKTTWDPKNPNTSAKSIADCMARWIGAYSKENNKRTLDKMDQDLKKQITPENNLAAFDASEASKNTKKLLLDANIHSPIPQTEFVLIRDYLMIIILTRNANRAGVPSNMTLGELKERRMVDGMWVLSVKDHKTAYHCGPAKVAITDVLLRWMLIYVKTIRQRATGNMDDMSPVFVAWHGQKMESGQIAHAINAAWARAGPEGGITGTLVRKSTVSAVHQAHPDMKG